MLGFGTLRKHLARGVSAVADLAKRAFNVGRAEVREAANDAQKSEGPGYAMKAWLRARGRSVWAGNNMGRAFDAPLRDCPGYFWKQDIAGRAWRLYRDRP